MNVKDSIYKFKEFISNIFVKKRPMLNSANDNIKTEPKVSVNTQKKETINDDSIRAMALQNKKERTLQEIIELTEKKPELLKTLDIEKLDVINKYYIEDTKKVREKNTKLKKEINALQTRLEELNKEKNFNRG